MKKRIIFTALGLVFLMVSASFATVMVPDHTGTAKPLSQIPDIMRHVTGKGKDGQPLTLPKHSLVLVTEQKNDSDSTVTLGSETYSFAANGVYKLSANKVKSTNTAYGKWEQTRGIYPVAVSKLNANEEKVTLVNVPQPYAYVKEDFFNILIKKSGDVVNFKTEKSKYTLNDVPVIMKQGLKAVSDDNDYFVTMSTTKNSSGVNARISVVSSTRYDGSDFKNVASHYHTINDAPTMEGGNYYIPADIAVDDFDGDGSKNEIAFVYSDTKAIFLKVLQFTGRGLKEIYSSTLHTYNSNRSFGLGFADVVKNLDGSYYNLSVSIAKGDFDGDGKKEFAVVFKDCISVTHNSNDAWWSGLSGAIRILTHKWNGTTFTHTESINTFDSSVLEEKNYRCIIKATLGVKAVGADLDGNGRDEVVILRTGLRFDRFWGRGGSGSPFVYEMVSTINVFEFDYGSLNPKEPWQPITNWQQSRNVWINIPLSSCFIQLNQDGDIHKNVQKTVTGTEMPLPFMDREFDIVAGKFTGNMGAGTICDEIIVKYPIRDGYGDFTKTGDILMHDRIVLVTNMKKGDHYELTELKSCAQGERVGLAVDDYFGESVELGNSVLTISDVDDKNYLAILQAPPYHVDNLTEDGTALQEQPRNFNYRRESSVRYENTNTKTESENVKFTMSNSYETIFMFDSPFVRDVAKTYNKIKGGVSKIIEHPGGSLIPGVPYIEKQFKGITGIIDPLLDRVKQTTEKTNSNASTTDIKISTAATRQDVLFVSGSKQYIWRYPILTRPVPYWLGGGSSATFGNAKVTDKEHFITFVINDSRTTRTAYGINDSNYQPTHEAGNLFSYPKSLEEIEGYTKRTEITKPITWEGPELTQEISLTKEKGEQKVTSTKVEKGIITTVASVIDSFFSTNLAKIPRVPNPKTFERTTKSTESLNIKIPEESYKARHQATFEGYIDVSGAMRVAFAVDDLNMKDKLWSSTSLYSLRPDPSFVLPEKFMYDFKKDDSGADTEKKYFKGNDNDPTALEMRGVRISVPDYGGMASNGVLMKGLKYDFEVPVYNASFRDVENVKVRLSYATENRSSANRIKITEATIQELPGWGNGKVNKTYVKFSWTPDITMGNYYLFAEIDPDGLIKEVHENRRDNENKIVDYGGNNLGYISISVVDESAKIYDRTSLKVSSSAADNYEEYTEEDYKAVYQYFYDHLKLTLNGFDNWESFWGSIADKDKNEPIVIEAKITYTGEYVVPSTTFLGYSYNEETTDRQSSGEEIAEDDSYLVSRELALIPNESTSFSFIAVPSMLREALFEMEVPDSHVASMGMAGEQGVSGSSSGGCNAGTVCLLSLGLLVFIKKRK